MTDPKYPAPPDADSWAFYQTEIFQTMMRRVIVYPFVTQVITLADNMYGEDMKQSWPEELSYETPVYIATLPGWKTKVTAEGVDEDRPLTMAFDKDLIFKANKPLPVTGYLIGLQEEYYRVMQENPVDYFANLDRTYTHLVLVQRYRTESVSRGDISSDTVDPVERSEYPHE